MDDIILIASSDHQRKSIMALLASEFPMKDLGPLGFFLGIVVTRHANDLFLSQSQHAVKITERAGMSYCSSSPTSVDTKLNFVVLQVHYNILHLLDQTSRLQFNRFACTCMIQRLNI